MFTKLVIVEVSCEHVSYTTNINKYGLQSRITRGPICIYQNLNTHIFLQKKKSLLSKNLCYRNTKTCKTVGKQRIYKGCSVSAVLFAIAKKKKKWGEKMLRNLSVHQKRNG